MFAPTWSAKPSSISGQPIPPRQPAPRLQCDALGLQLQLANPVSNGIAAWLMGIDPSSSTRPAPGDDGRTPRIVVAKEHEWLGQEVLDSQTLHLKFTDSYRGDGASTKYLCLGW